MIGSTRQVSVWAFGQPCDMRKAFDTLHALVTLHLKRDLLTGDLFLFVGKDRKRAKVLLWDGTGVCIYAKRLSKGRFAAPWLWGGQEARLTTSELALFLEGCALVGQMPLSPAAFTWDTTSRKETIPQKLPTGSRR